MSDLTKNEIFQLVVRLSIASLVTFYSLKWMMNYIDPTNKSKKKARNKAEQQLKRLMSSEGVSNVNINALSEYELVIASQLVLPEQINISWDDIAGLDGVVKELKENVILPMKHQNLFASSRLLQAPKGVLLHGPPGCGKTLIAKATAKEGGMRFLNLDVAMLTDKWYGESQKLASAVFSLAIKLQPCIIFIDEIDSFLRARNATDHEATAMMKTQFMMMWDGLESVSGRNVIVIGATNRPQDLDKAILRRMPTQLHIGLPNDLQRLQILRLILEDEPQSDDVDLNRLSKLTNGFSGSDLLELCRSAKVYRIHEYIKRNPSEIPSTSTGEITDNKSEPPPICMQDLISSLAKLKESKLHTGMHIPNPRIDLD